MPELAVAVAVAVAGTLLGEAVGRDVGDGRAAGAAEHALTKTAEVTMRTAISPFHIATIVLPVKGPRGCVVSTGQADGSPRAEERRSSSLIRTAGRQLPTLLTLSLPSQ